MPHRVPKRLNACILLLGAGLAWTALSPPAADASMRLDTGGVPEPEIASALKRAFQLPLLVAVAGSTDEEDAAVERERARLQRLMVELGYLDAAVGMERSAAGTVLRPVLGRRYTVGFVELKGVRQSELGPDIVTDLAERVRELVGKPATAVAIQAFGRQALQSVGERDFALARLDGVKWIRAGDGLVIAFIDLDTGPARRFGDVTFKGMGRTAVADLERLVPFRHGDRYERAQVERLRANLRANETIGSFNIDLSEGADGTLAVGVRVRETPPDLSVLHDPGPLGLGSGLAALGALALTQIAAVTGVPRTRRRLLALGSALCVLTFAVTVTPRLVSFLS